MNSDASSPEPAERVHRRRFYGRRRGPGLGARQRHLLESGLSGLAIALDKGDLPLDPVGLFGRNSGFIGLEIGFGKGEHLAQLAARYPERDFIGCEPFLNGLATMAVTAQETGLRNVRLFGDDARLLIDRLPDQCIDIVFLLHPDPWPKRRHRKRRFLNEDNLDAIARILKPGGEFRIATDSEIYKRWAAIRMSARQDFEWLAERAADWRTPPPDWLATRYARKAVREGRSDAWFRYRRCPSSNASSIARSSAATAAPGPSGWSQT